MAIPDTYFDLNETVYCTAKANDNSVSSASSIILTYGLSDLAELPGQSTWFVNKLQFQIQGFQNIDPLRVRLKGFSWPRLYLATWLRV